MEIKLLSIYMFCDYIPGVSSLTNTLTILARVTFYLSKTSTASPIETFKAHVLTKNTLRCLILIFLPVVGNVVFCIYDCLLKPHSSQTSHIVHRGVTISDYSEEETHNHNAFKHLDIGSANYGPEAEKIEYQHTDTDPTGKQIHRVLFHTCDQVISLHQDRREFVFYLNDISAPGLNKAAENLALHLKEQHADKNLTIKINAMCEFSFGKSAHVNFN